MRATRRQPRSGQKRPAWPGNAMDERPQRHRRRTLQPVRRRVARRRLDAVEAVGVAARRRAVDVAPVREQSVEHDERARRRLDRHEAVGRCRQRASSRATNRVPSSLVGPARSKRCRSGPRCPPGWAHRHPFSSVASSMANQKPTTLSGSVYRNVASWWQPTSPPMCGCLKMYIDWIASGSAIPMPSATSASSGV